VASGPENLTGEQRDWLRRSEELWLKAQEIVREDPDRDLGNVYHALRNLELTPAERLQRGLNRVRRSRPNGR
jgi:hypothetical protein